jgi:hypothetical protein
MDVKKLVKLLKDIENTARISRLYEKVHGTMNELEGTGDLRCGNLRKPCEPYRHEGRREYV